MNDVTSIPAATAFLHSGKLVAFPTETVYGLGADATNDRAVADIYAAKGRPDFNPLIIHVASVAALDSLIEWNETARVLAEKFWPGPLTLVLPRVKNCPVSLLASAGLDTLAVRIPSHPMALELLRVFGKPVAAPSANMSGKLSPTSAAHVAESLGDKVALILDGGASSVGVESTVVDCTQPNPVILRHGGVTQEDIENVVGNLGMAGTIIKGVPHLSPGQLASHYAPNLPLRLNAYHVSSDEALLAFGNDAAIGGGATCLNLSLSGNLSEAAANLFTMLRQLDASGAQGIAVMPIPETGLGAAMNDRLRRASVL
jgi:L-threonylcarbamoyladenylate synthase